VTPLERSARIKRRARELGFDAVGITDLAPPPHADVLDRWLAAGMAGTMRYLHRQARRRKDPATIVPGATRAVVVTRTYYTPDPAPQAGAGRVAKYARGRDYHDSLRGPLEALRRDLIDQGADPGKTRAYVDAGPVPERELAQRAGLGWIGKNTMLLARDRGSFFFLAIVLTDLDLAVDQPVATDHCGTCTRCLEACPTGALPEPRLLDATRCISYLTIEFRGTEFPDPALLGDQVFGCDICQDVCPWNVKFAAEAGGVPEFDSARGVIPLRELVELSAPDFDRRYGATPLARPGRDGMRRNAIAAMANAERPCPTP
jgi:epoxyqueuosine reductase